MALRNKVISALRILYGQMRFIGLLPRNLKAIFEISKRDSFYPEVPRKGKCRILWENIVYLIRYHEVNSYYISYGFDGKNFRNQEEYITHIDFINARNKGNQAIQQFRTGDYNYLVLLRDKYVFANYLSSVIGAKNVVMPEALVINGKVFIYADKKWCLLDEYLEEPGRRVFKMLDGECAEGVHLVEINQDQVIVDGGSPCRKSAFIEKTKNHKYLVQNVVDQCEQLNRFKTKSVSTVRIITVKGQSGFIGVFSAFLRLSVDTDSFVDNRAKGGLGVGIDIETGKLFKYGYPHDGFGNKTSIHGPSGIVFDGYQLPFWKEVKELVLKAHEQFYNLQSIGWDVVITPKGPCLLEGNDNWEIGGPQDTCGGLKSRWEKLVNA